MRQTRKSYRNFVRAVIESVESRRMFNTTYFDLASGNLSQDWSTTTLISANNDWSGVPSIEGYGGTGVTATGADPQTALTFGTSVLNVTANQNSGGLSTGGVLELDGVAITNKVVALQPTNTNVSPFLMFRLNTVGVTDVHAKYNLRDVDTAADIAPAPVALQYRIGETGDFINLPAGFVANAATAVANDATLTTAVDVTLPPALEGQSQLQLRVIVTNQTGSDQMIGVDDIIVSGTATTPVPGSLSFTQTNYTVAEGVGTATISVTRSGGSSGAVSADWSTVAGGSATVVDDYAAASGTVSWLAGESGAKTFTVTIVDDAVSESDETINLALSNLTGGATAGANQTSTITISDNEPPVAPAGVRLNEVSVNPPATDNPYEFFEIIGPANQSLNNFYFVSVEGDSGANVGQATAVFSLGGNSLGTNGLLLGKAVSGGHDKEDTATTVVTFATLDTVGGIFQNGSNSFVLIYSTAAITLNQDLDSNNDGTLELGTTGVVIDGVGWTDNGATDKVVTGAANLAPNGTGFTFQPTIASRTLGNTAAGDVSAWYYGVIDGTVGSSASKVYSTTSASANLPSGALLTPGAANFATSADNIPPTVSSKVFDFDTSAVVPSLTVTFSEPMSGITLSDLASSTFTITDRSTNTAIPAASFTLTPVSTSVYKITFVGTNNAPADGDFKLTINAANAKDVAGNALAADESLNYAFLQGDASADRKVNTLDFNLLAGNFGNGGRKFSQGEFSFDGNIDSTDFTILVGQYGKSLPSTPPPAPVLSAVGGVGASLFGNAGIDDDGITSTDLV